MASGFHWRNKEANFGQPEEKEIDGGTHFTIEIILKHKGKFIMVRRPKGYAGHQLPPKAEKNPRGCFYFCHDLPRWGESLAQAVKRIVRSQIDVGIKNFRVAHLTMEKYPDKLHGGNRQWAMTLFVEAGLSELPKLNDKVTETVRFNVNNIPDEMGWWEEEELKEFVKRFM